MTTSPRDGESDTWGTYNLAIFALLSFNKLSLHFTKKWFNEFENVILEMGSQTLEQPTT